MLQARKKLLLNPKSLRLFVVFLLIAFAATLTGCGGGGGGSEGADANNQGCVLTPEQIENLEDISDLPPECLDLLPQPDNSILGRIFVLGTQVDALTGELRIYANGLDLDGNPLVLADFQTATVTVDDAPVAYAVEQVSAGDAILSLGFVTDHSRSITDAELVDIGNSYSLILNRMPQVFEGEVVNFSDTASLRQDWTEDLPTLLDAVQPDLSIPRNSTALYDALGVALQRDLGLLDDGLVERCRPAHMLVVFTDGKENASISYTKATLLPIIEQSNTVMIMLGTLLSDVGTMQELAGDQGAYIYAYNIAGISTLIDSWSDSLSHMVKFTLDPATGFDTGTIKIALGTETVVVERPTDGFCEAP